MKKLVKDIVVMTEQEGKFRAGRVSAFLEHVPPGYEDTHPDSIPAIAEVAWFADAVPAQGISNGMADDLNCPVFRRVWQDNPAGNL